MEAQPMKKPPFFLLPLAALALVGCNFDVNAEDKRLTSDADGCRVPRAIPHPLK